MSFSMFDGLGGNEVQTGSRAGMPTQSPFVTGSLTVGGAVNLNAGFSLTGSLVSAGNSYYTAGSPYNVGWVTIPLTARSIISGGAWVGGSGGLAYQLGASPKCPIGVAAATAASGATVNVIVGGVVPMIADGTIATIGGCFPGAGAAGNTVSPHVAGSATQYSTLSNAGSEAVVFVVLK